ncbi:MAG: hypothetical protein ABI947_12405 [Chloroflexota bacterium]
MNIKTIEIRNYLLKSNLRERFIDYFEEHFIFSQQERGLGVLGQFSVIGNPDHFVWLRGFSDMQTRRNSLQEFYDGPVWGKYGPLANDMMLEWHNVHLVCPLTDIADLTCGLSADIVAADLAAGTMSPYLGIIAIDFFQALPGKRDELINKFRTQVVPAYESEAIQLRGYFVAEMGENTFSRLPVIQNEDEFVVITAYENEEVCWEKRKKVALHINEATEALLCITPDALLLSPTLRSPLRYLHK